MKQVSEFYSVCLSSKLVLCSMHCMAISWHSWWNIQPCCLYGWLSTKEKIFRSQVVELILNVSWHNFKTNLIQHILLFIFLECLLHLFCSLHTRSLQNICLLLLRVICMKQIFLCLLLMVRPLLFFFSHVNYPNRQFADRQCLCLIRLWLFQLCALLIFTFWFELHRTKKLIE